MGELQPPKRPSSVLANFQTRELLFFVGFCSYYATDFYYYNYMLISKIDVLLAYICFTFIIFNIIQ
jgi:hypothetical protein